MPQNRLAAAAIVVSMIFALVIALLAVMGSGSLTTVAVVGGILVGVMWVVVGVLGTPGRSRRER